jgi:hypothetical protein
MPEKNNDLRTALISIACAAVLGLSGWSLINTIQLKVDVAVMDQRMANMERLLEAHVRQPVALYPAGE